MNKMMMRTIKQSKLCMLKNSTGIGIWAEIYIATERKYKILLIWLGKFCLSTGHLPPLLTSCCSLRAAARTVIDLLCLMPLSAIFQLYHGDQF
jgi:hypothetical protein